MTPVIETDKLTKLYRGGRGISDLDLEVRQGEVFGFLGPNGAGKTTTIRTLMGLMRPTSGSARILGCDIRRQSVEIRSRVGNLPDDISVEPKLTGRRLLELYGRIRGVGDLSYADELADRFDADLDEQMGRLSRGNRQKIGLIQAMFHRPELLILDEPTAGLDPFMQEEFVHLVGEWRAEGRSIFVSSHLLSEVERICDRIGIIREGTVIAVEKVDDLIRRSIRRVSVTFASPVASGEFESIDGVERVRADGNALTFRVLENMDAVVKAVALHKVIDLEVEHPSLDEIFRAYYGGDAESVDTDDGAGSVTGEGAGE